KKSAEFIAISDLDGNVIFLNEGGQKLVGLPNLQTALKTKVENYHPPEVFKFLYQEICPIILKQGHWEGESLLQHFVTKATIPVLLTSFILQDSQTGEPNNIVSIMHDITHLKEAEQTMQVALEQERELGELRSRFISMASHEFRTPLSIISSSTEIIQKYHERLTPEKQATHFQRIQTSVHHMTRLLDDVLLVSRAEANKLPFNPTEENIKDFCTQLVEELQVGNNEHQIRFTAKAKGPASPQKWQITFDAKLIRQILTNLLINAIKYSPQGGEVELKLNRAAGQTIFQVKDNGIGIPPEDFARLFTPFHRAHNVGTIQGTGLGLTIIQKCVELHNGTIKIESKIGVGTCFTVTIPDHP
ncbi:MAG: ATP-binding protein, partial [Microcystaceae cyanobacterium]